MQPVRHAVRGTARVPGRRLRYLLVAGLLAVMQVVVIATLSVTPARADSGPPVGDEFSGNALDSGLWSVVDPLGDAAVSVAGGQLSIAIPGGTPHDFWSPELNSPRILQPVADQDIDVQARFTSPVTQASQSQGLLAVGGDRVVRFDQYSDGNSYHIFAATFENPSSPTIRNVAQVSAVTPVNLRLTRTGDDWTLRWSPDGVSWNTTATFSFALDLEHVGVFAGTARTPSPAFTARVDYFRTVTTDSTQPTVSQVAAAPSVDGATVTWTTDEPASSTVEFGTTAGYGDSAGTSALTTNHQVGLVGLSCATTYHFRVLSTDSGGNTAIGSDGTFATGTCPPPDTTPPQISNIDAQPTATGAVITWSTDKPASSRVDYGGSASYGHTAQGSDNTTTHTVTLGGLSCGTAYFYRVSSTDAAGNQALGPAGTFTTTACQEESVSTDEFSGTALNTSLWSLIDPVGDATVAVEQDRLRFSVPPGVSHDFWMPNQAPRLMQGAADADIAVEAKFDSAVTGRFQSQGLVAQDAAGRLLRYDTYSDGSRQLLFGATFANGTPNTELVAELPSTTPIYLGLRRVGDVWTLRWSADNATWNTAATFTFAIDLAAVGVFVGNAGDNPATTAQVDYFRVTGSGGSTPPPTPPLTISGVSAAPGGTSADLSWTTNRAANSSLDYGTTTAYGQTLQDSAQVTAHLITVTGLQCATTYHYRVTSTDSAAAVATSPDGTFTTAACGPPDGEDPPGGGADAFTSDDFSGPLDTARWTVLDPAGDGQVGTTGTNVALYVPTNTTHDMWTGQKTGLQLLQAAQNTDFEVETKFETRLELTRQTIGMLVKQDAATFLRFDLTTEGSQARIFAATVAGGSVEVRLNQVVPATDAVYLRIRREGTNWTLRHSGDGSSWTTDATFAYATTVHQVGPYVANSLGPAAVASVDYVSNLAAPVDDDGGAPPAQTQPGQIQPFYGDTLDVGVRGFPQQWVGVLGRASDPDGVAQLWYSLNNSAPRPLNIGPDQARLRAAGDFVAEPDRAELLPGTNTVALTLLDRLGRRTTRTVTLNNVNGAAPTLPHTVDWGDADSISDWGQAIDGPWQIIGDTVRILEPGYDRLIGIGSTEWPAGYEVTVPVTVHSPYSEGAGILVGWSGHTGNQQPRIGHPYGALAWFRDNRLELVDTNAVSVITKAAVLPLDVPYNYKLRAEPQGNGNSLYSFKVWPVGSPEPAAWDLSTTLPSRAGSTLLLANSVDASFGTVVVNPL